MTYREAIRALNDAAWAAVRAANKEEGTPVDALKVIARDTDSLVDHGVTYAKMQDMLALYEGAKAAGLTGEPEC